MPRTKYVKLKPADFEALLICSIRYSLGRRSYITGWVSDIIRAYRGLLSSNTVDVLIRDIVNAPSLGDESIDAKFWIDLKNKLEEVRREGHQKRVGISRD